MQLPTVNLNGTSGKELFRLNLAVVDHLRETIDALSKASPHGRDYQTLEPDAWKKAVSEHDNRLALLRGVMCEMQSMVEYLTDFVRGTR